MLSYSGKGYDGLQVNSMNCDSRNCVSSVQSSTYSVNNFQINPDAKTLDDVIETAVFNAGFLEFLLFPIVFVLILSTTPLLELVNGVLQIL